MLVEIFVVRRCGNVHGARELACQAEIIVEDDLVRLFEPAVEFVEGLFVLRRGHREFHVFVDGAGENDDVVRHVDGRRDFREEIGIGGDQNVRKAFFGEFRDRRKELEETGGLEVRIAVFEDASICQLNVFTAFGALAQFIVVLREDAVDFASGNPLDVVFELLLEAFDHLLVREAQLRPAFRVVEIHPLAFDFGKEFRMRLVVFVRRDVHARDVVAEKHLLDHAIRVVLLPLARRP